MYVVENLIRTLPAIIESSLYPTPTLIQKFNNGALKYLVFNVGSHDSLISCFFWKVVRLLEVSAASKEKGSRIQSNLLFVGGSIAICGSSMS